MKHTFQRIITCAIIAATVFATSVLSQAADSSTTAPAAKSDPNGPNRFYGPISKIDTNKMTFVVGDQTFKIVPESEVTKDDKKATIADAVNGEPARGTYTKKADGTLNVTKVRFGKKSGGGSGGKTGGTGAGAKSGGKSGGKRKADGTAPAKTE